MYLYVLKSDALERVPEELLTAFGKPQQGYHLQMPPAEDDYIEHLPEELLRRNDPM